MKTLTNEQAAELLKLKPFAIIQMVHADEDFGGVGFFDACIMATNINSEHCYLELLERLKDEIESSIGPVPVGISLYRCDMYFYDGYNGYESNPYWEIVGYDLLSHEPLEAAEEA